MIQIKQQLAGAIYFTYSLPNGDDVFVAISHLDISERLRLGNFLHKSHPDLWVFFRTKSAEKF